MRDCEAHAENLALLAGGDLPAGDAQAVAVTEHVEGCASCRELLEALRSDLGRVAESASILSGLAARRTAANDLSSAVLAELARTESRRAPAPGSRRKAVLELAAAAALVVTGGSLWLGGSSWLGWTGGERSHRGVEIAASSAADLQDDGRPVAVRHAGGGAVELQWNGDGREARFEGGASTYRVLASASPRDFSEATRVEVAGHSLVASSALPAFQEADRSITYFRVH